MKNVKKIVLISSLVGFSAVAAISGAVSWFASETKLPQYDIFGSSAGAYFAYGNGNPLNTENNDRPFGISHPRHLYNLAWLTYTGFFKDKQCYFELAKNVPETGLDMSGYILPPIGTKDYPFVSNFNGNGKIIKNLTVSNDQSVLFASTNKHPKESQMAYTAPEIVGMFGVVGNLAGSKYTGTYDSSINQIYDLGITDFTIQSTTSKALAGILAGYVDGKVSNVAVNDSGIDIQNSGVDNVSDSWTENISDYGVVGYATASHVKNIKRIEQNLYDINISTGHEFNATDDGNSQGWGGSINMKTIYNRIVSVRRAKSYNAAANNTANWRIEKTYTDGEVTNTVNHNTITSGDAYSRYNGFNETGHEYIGSYNVYARSVNDGYGDDYNDTYGDQQYLYLLGGHYENRTYNVQNEHTGYKITDGNGHYLSVTQFTSANSTNAGTIGNTDEANATLWTIPEGNTGYIYTKYHYNNSSTETTYYLYIYNNTTLRLSTNTNSRTSFTKATNASGKIRYSAGNYFISYENGWLMSPIPTAPNPATYSSYMQDGYQISYSTNYISKASNTTTGVATGLSSTNTYGWKFEYNNNDVTIENAVGKSVRIYTQTGTTKYYLYDSANSSPWKMNLSNNRNNSTQYSISRNSDGTYKLTHGNYVLVYDSSNNVFSTRTEGSAGTYASISITRTETILNEYNDLVAKTYCIAPTTEETKKGPDYTVDTANSTANSHMYYTAEDTTYLPLNVENDFESYISNANTVNSNISAGNLDPKDSNTGYLISGSNVTSNLNTFDSQKSNIRVSRYGISNIDSSYSVSVGSTSTISDLADSNVYTINTSGSTVTMNNVSSDNYPRYIDSKTTFFQNSLTSTEDSGKTYTANRYVYGLHFMDSTITMNSIVNAKKVSVLGNKCDNYQFPVDSIDFNLKQKGVVNFFAGTYFSNNNSFFSLHEIIRNNDGKLKQGSETEYESYNTISNIKEIEEIYSTDVGTKTTKYANIYKYKGATGDAMYSVPYRIDGNQNKYSMSMTSTEDTTNPYTYATMNATDFNKYVSTYGYTLRFKTSQIGKQSSAITTNRIYYFEFPMNPGEYCLGSVSGGTGAYLLYLDIGANAAKTQRTIIYEHFDQITKAFDYPEGVAIVAVSTVAENLANGKAIDETNTSNVVIYAGYNGIVNISRNANEVTLERTGAITSAKPTLVGDLMWDDTHQQYNIHNPDGDNLTKEIVSEKTVTDVRRIKYFDYNVNLDELTVTTITDTSENGGAYTRTFLQEYANGKSSTDASEIKVYNTNGGTKYSEEELTDQDNIKTYDESVNTNVLITITCAQEDGVTFTYDWVIEYSVDDTISAGRYYKFDDYKFEVTIEGGTVTIKVIELGDKTIYIGNTLVTSKGQEITL